MAEIRGKTTLDNTGLKTGLNQAKGLIGKFSSDAFKYLGPLIGFGGFAALTKGAVDAGGELNDLSKSMGLSVEHLQLLQAEAGGAANVLEATFVRMRLRTEQAAQGNKSFLKVFKQLRINFDEFYKADQSTRFEIMAKSVMNAEDKTKALANASLILGRSTLPKLLDTLQTVSEVGMDGLAEKTGRTILVTEEATQTLNDFGTQVENTRKNLMALAMNGIAKVINAGQGWIAILKKTGPVGEVLIKIVTGLTVALSTGLVAQKAYVIGLKMLTVSAYGAATGLSLAARAAHLFKAAVVSTGIGAILVGLTWMATELWMAIGGSQNDDGLEKISEDAEKGKKELDALMASLDGVEDSLEGVGKQMTEIEKKKAFEKHLQEVRKFKDEMDALEDSYKRIGMSLNEEIAHLDQKFADTSGPDGVGDAEAIYKERERLRLRQAQARYDFEQEILALQDAETLKRMTLEDRIAEIRKRAQEDLAKQDYESARKNATLMASLIDQRSQQIKKEIEDLQKKEADIQKAMEKRRNATGMQVQSLQRIGGGGLIGQVGNGIEKINRDQLSELRQIKQKIENLKSQDIPFGGV